jgi:methylated-DNA-[protein]-cysteine S-methyltransferase
MTHYYSTFSTPAGDFSAAVNDTGALIATAFGDIAALRGRLIAPVELLRDPRRVTRVREQIAAYFDDKLQTFSLPLAPAGTVFQKRVWIALAAIPFGATRSYGELASNLRTSPRAIGRANATNPICLIVPCHRVIGADGSLTGFAFGEEIKRQLLQHERTSSVKAA